MRREAIRTLPDIVRDEMIENDHTAITVKVRDEDAYLRGIACRLFQVV
ncbi:hypothetical protein [Mesorhizobium sp. B2-4-12]|nr:hypothetical protein [Mesorhizobium sp. B2-4-12]